MASRKGTHDNTPSGTKEKKSKKEKAVKEPPGPIPDAGWATLSLLLGLAAIAVVGIAWYMPAVLPIAVSWAVGAILFLFAFSSAMQGYANRKAAKGAQALAEKEIAGAQEARAAIQDKLETVRKELSNQIESGQAAASKEQAKLVKRFEAMETWVEQEAVPIVQNPGTIVGPIVDAREDAWNDKLDQVRKSVRDVEAKIPHVPNHDGINQRMDALEASNKAWHQKERKRLESILMESWGESLKQMEHSLSPIQIQQLEGVMQRILESQGSHVAAPSAPAPYPAQPQAASAQAQPAQASSGWDPGSPWRPAPSASVMPPQAAPAPPTQPAPGPVAEPAAAVESPAAPATAAKPPAKKAKPAKAKPAEKAKPAKAPKQARAKKAKPAKAEPAQKAKPAKAEKQAPAETTQAAAQSAPADAESVQKRIEQARKMVKRRRPQTKVR